MAVEDLDPKETVFLGGIANAVKEREAMFDLEERIQGKRISTAVETNMDTS